MEVPKIDWLWDAVIKESHDFHLLLEKGKDIILNTKSEFDQSRFLAEIEPDPDDSKAYDVFISELHKKKAEFIRIDGTPEQYAEAMHYKVLAGQIKELQDKKQASTNKLKKIMNDGNANILQFDEGRITWNKKFYVNVK
jgi:hypothetical protein